MKRIAKAAGVRLRLIGILMIFLLGYAAIARASSVRCRFSDEQGKVLRNVEARLTLVESGERQFQKSNKSGEVAFNDLKHGSYELMAQLKGFVAVKRAVEVTGDQNVDQVLMTEKAFDRLDEEARGAIKDEHFSQALPALQKLLANYPDDAALHFNLGLVYAGLQQEDKALSEAAIAARLDAQFADSKGKVEGTLLRERGQIALKSQDFAAAATAFEKWVQLDPKNDQAYYGLALAYGHQGKYPEALAAVNKAIELSPKNESYLSVKQILETNAGKK